MYAQAHRKPLAPIDGQSPSEQQSSPRHGSAPSEQLPQYTRPMDPPQVPDMEARMAALRRDALQMMADRTRTPGLDTDSSRYAGYPSQKEADPSHASGLGVDNSRYAEYPSQKVPDPYHSPAHDTGGSSYAGHPSQNEGPVYRRMYDGVDYQMQRRSQAADPGYDIEREELMRARSRRTRPSTARIQEPPSPGVQDRLVLDDGIPDDQEADPSTGNDRKNTVTFKTPPHTPTPPPNTSKRSATRKPRARSASPSITKSRKSPMRLSVGPSQTIRGGFHIAKRQAKPRDPHPRGTMVHLSTLVTKPPGPPPKAPEKLTFDKLEDHGMRYMHVGCHDWACNCLVPQTVRRQALDGRGSRGQVPSVHSRRHYMVPGGSTLVNKGQHEVMQHSTQGQMMIVDSTQDTKQLSPENSMDKSKSSINAKLSKGPISAPGAFLVSAPHWKSRSHTQRWPWGGKVQAHVWPHPEGGLRLVDAALAPRASGVSMAT